MTTHQSPIPLSARSTSSARGIRPSPNNAARAYAPTSPSRWPRKHNVTRQSGSASRTSKHRVFRHSGDRGSATVSTQSRRSRVARDVGGQILCRCDQAWLAA